MCRRKSDRRILIRALKRIASPPESVEGQLAWTYAEGISMEKQSLNYQRNLIDYLQRVAAETLDRVERGDDVQSDTTI